MPKGGVGPYRKTPEMITKLETAAAVDASIDEMAFYAGISVQTYYNWIKDDPELKERLERLRLTPVLKAKNAVAKNADQIETAKWLLERKRREEYGRNQKDADAAKEARSSATYTHDEIANLPLPPSLMRLFQQQDEKAPALGEENADETGN